MTLTPLSSLDSFLDSGGRNDPNTAEFARVGRKKIFDELDVHHV